MDDGVELNVLDEEAAKLKYDAFGFPLDQRYICSSSPAPLRLQHFLRWARFWRRVTLQGVQPKSLRRSRAMRTMVWGGIPIAFRGTVWAILLDVPQRRNLSPPGYYRSLLSGVTGYGVPRSDAAIIDQIAKDTDRTWPRHRWLDTAALKRVLTAWSRHNPEVGYCQGLNSVAAMLLLLQAEEWAFWSLVQLLETRLPAGFYGTTLWRCHAEIEARGAHHDSAVAGAP